MVRYRTRYCAPSSTFLRLAEVNSNLCLLHSRVDQRVKAWKTSVSPLRSLKVSLHTIMFKALISKSSTSSEANTRLASLSINSRHCFNKSSQQLTWKLKINKKLLEANFSKKPAEKGAWPYTSKFSLAFLIKSYLLDAQTFSLLCIFIFYVAAELLHKST